MSHMIEHSVRFNGNQFFNRLIQSQWCDIEHRVFVHKIGVWFTPTVSNILKIY